LKIEVKPNKDKIIEEFEEKIVKKIAKKMTKEEVEKAVKTIIIREAEKQGLKLGAKGVLTKVLSKVNPALALLSAFESGWTIGSILKEFTPVGEVAKEAAESELNEKDREEWQNSGKMGKGWILFKKIPSLFKIAGKALGGGLGKSVGKVVNADDNAMAETNTMDLSFFRNISVEDKIQYIKDIGGIGVREEEEERIVKIIEYSTPVDRQRIFNHPDVFREYRMDRIDGADREKLEKLMKEGVNEQWGESLTTFQKYELQKKIVNFRTIIINEPRKSKEILADAKAEMSRLDATLQNLISKNLIKKSSQNDEEISFLTQQKNILNSVIIQAEGIKTDVFPDKLKRVLDKVRYYEENKTSFLKSFWEGYLDFMPQINELTNDYIKYKQDPKSSPWNSETEIENILYEVLLDQMKNWKEGEEFIKHATPSYLTAD